MTQEVSQIAFPKGPRHYTSLRRIFETVRLKNSQVEISLKAAEL